MADVRSSDRRDRAQLILVSGLMIAVTLVVLVLLLNTVIYTENVATRGLDSDVGDAASFQQDIDREVATIIAAEHHFASGPDFEGTHRGLEALFTQQRNRSLERGHVADANATIVPGLYLDQSGGVFADIKATGVNESADLWMTVDPSTLDNTTNEQALAVSVDEDTLYFNRSDDDLELWDSDTRICNDLPEDTNVTVDLRNGTVDGTENCAEELWSVTDPTNSTIEIASNNDTDAEGAYGFVLGGSHLSSEDAGADWFVYHVEVDITYLSADLRYETSRIIDGVIDP